jgi:tRNA/rRNA methyltransferase
MGNFGVSDLRLVNPCAHLHSEAHKFAANASPLLGSAQVFPDLASALYGLDLSIAATRRGGQRRAELLDSSELPALVATLPAGSRVGLVFGREDVGLSNAEVVLCSRAAAIATSAAGLGSLNLAQAVLLFLYELARRRK